VSAPPAKILSPAPPFEARAVDGACDERSVTLHGYAGRWLVLFFYPRDFTQVCPTEVIEFSKRAGEFRALGAELLGVSADDVETHRRWIREALGPIAYPLASDPGGRIARAYGAWLEGPGVAARATFVIDAAGVVQYAAYHNLAVGRSPSEVLRVLEALRTGAPSPAEWRAGEPTLPG
jgi:alkyl hydroperoxide reductase subunit AhpC